MVIVNGSLMPIGFAQKSDKLTKIDGSNIIIIESIEKIKQKVPTYNFEIDKTSNTYVAENLMAYSWKLDSSHFDFSSGGSGGSGSGQGESVVTSLPTNRVYNPFSSGIIKGGSSHQGQQGE